jgi:CRISPR/Cas system-associated protein Csm6
MEHEKNLHASIPTALLADAYRFAEEEHISVDELVRDAMQRRIEERRRQKLYTYGEAQARKLGIREEDVERIVHEHREEMTRHGH